MGIETKFSIGDGVIYQGEEHIVSAALVTVTEYPYRDGPQRDVVYQLIGDNRWHCQDDLMLIRDAMFAAIIRTGYSGGSPRDADA